MLDQPNVAHGAMVFSFQGSPHIRNFGGMGVVAIILPPFPTAKFPNPKLRTTGWGQVMPPPPTPVAG